MVEWSSQVEWSRTMVEWNSQGEWSRTLVEWSSQVEWSRVMETNLCLLHMMKTDTVSEETLVLCKHKCTHCINASLEVTWYQESVRANTISSVCCNKRWCNCRQLIIIWAMLCWLFSWANPLFKNKKKKSLVNCNVQCTYEPCPTAPYVP